MTPFEQAARWHLANCPGVPFHEVVEAHFMGGHVIAGPRLFLMGRRVWHVWPEDALLNPWLVAKDGNAWHVWLFAGDLRAIPPAIPYPLPWVSFHRRGRLVRGNMERVLSRAGQ